MVLTRLQHIMSKKFVCFFTPCRHQCQCNCIFFLHPWYSHYVVLTNAYGIQDLILESDSLLIINEIKDVGDSISLQGNLIIKIKELMRKFESCNIQHTGRDRNEVAHKLAKHAWHVNDRCIWWDSFQNCISQIIWFEKLRWGFDGMNILL